MAVRKTFKELIGEQKKKGGFMDGLKEWVISPGGIVTIILFVGTIAYVFHTSKKK